MGWVRSGRVGSTIAKVLNISLETLFLSDIKGAVNRSVRHVQRTLNVTVFDMYSDQ